MAEYYLRCELRKQPGPNVERAIAALVCYLLQEKAAAEDNNTDSKAASHHAIRL